jgi:hypothetical protein
MLMLANARASHRIRINTDVLVRIYWILPVSSWHVDGFFTVLVTGRIVPVLSRLEYGCFGRLLP